MLKTKIHELRREKKINQSELAAIVGVRRETIVCLENGKYNPSLKLAMRIARYFEMTVEDIFAFDEEDYDPENDQK